jgi:hypothetical protein
MHPTSTPIDHPTHISKQPKRHKPRNRDDHVPRPVEEPGREGYQPHERDDDRETRDHFGIDEAAFGPARTEGAVVEVGAWLDGNGGGYYVSFGKAGE